MWRNPALRHKAKIAQSLLLLGDEEAVVGGAVTSLGALADGTGAAGAFARPLAGAPSADVTSA